MFQECYLHMYVCQFRFVRNSAVLIFLHYFACVFNANADNWWSSQFIREYSMFVSYFLLLLLHIFPFVSLSPHLIIFSSFFFSNNFESNSISFFLPSFNPLIVGIQVHFTIQFWLRRTNLHFACKWIHDHKWINDHFHLMNKHDQQITSI